MYWEQLPPSCPPVKAQDGKLAMVYRRIDGECANEKDFRSHAYLRKQPLHPVDPCRWASCSLFRNKQQISNISSKLPKPRDYANFIAELNIPKGSGKWVEKSTGHIDFWSYAQFTITSAVDNIYPIEQDKL